jgi:hypothetical protein
MHRTGLVVRGIVEGIGKVLTSVSRRRGLNEDGEVTRTYVPTDLSTYEIFVC